MEKQQGMAQGVLGSLLRNFVSMGKPLKAFKQESDVDSCTF